MSDFPYDGGEFILFSWFVNFLSDDFFPTFNGRCGITHLRIVSEPPEVRDSTWMTG